MRRKGERSQNTLAFRMGLTPKEARPFIGDGVPPVDVRVKIVDSETGGSHTAGEVDLDGIAWREGYRDRDDLRAHAPAELRASLGVTTINAAANQAPEPTIDGEE